MYLVEIFGGLGRKKVKTPEELDAEEEARRQRVNTIRTANKPDAGKKDFNVADKSGVEVPEALAWQDYLIWHKGEAAKYTKFSSEGPKIGDVIMSQHGPLTVGNPNGGGHMKATVRAKNGDEGTVGWTKLSRPVKHGDRQYYVYEGK